MKKTLLMAAAALAAGIITSQAQPVYSQNIVGYVNLPIQGSGVGTYSLISNPLNAGNNTISNLVQNPTDGTTVFYWVGNGFGSSQFSFGSWDVNATNTIPPGQGVFVQTTGNFTNTFVGTVVVQGAPGSTNVLVHGYSIISSQYPIAGTADSLGLTPVITDGDILYKWNYANQGYDAYQWAFGGWSGPNSGTTAPTLNIGEAAFASLQNSANWINTNSIP